MGLVSARFCGHCGRELTPESHFCSGCGQAVRQPGDVTPPATPPASAPPAPDSAPTMAWPGNPATQQQDTPPAWPGDAIGSRSPGDAGAGWPGHSPPAWPDATAPVWHESASPAGPDTARPDTAGPVWPPAAPAADVPAWQENSDAWFRPEGGSDGKRKSPGPPQAGGYPSWSPPDAGHSTPGQDGDPRRSIRWPVVLGIVLIVALGGTAAAMIAMRTSHGTAGATPPGSSPTAGPSPTAGSPSSGAQAQAARNLSGLLALSVSDRGAIDVAVSDVSRCGSRLTQDASTLRNAATSRRRLLSRLGSMPGQAALPPRLLGSLAKAWRASAQADQDLAAWAADQSQHCSRHSSSDPHFKAATGPDIRATRFKKVFAALWDPIAASHGLPRYQWSQL